MFGKGNLVIKEGKIHTPKGNMYEEYPMFLYVRLRIHYSFGIRAVLSFVRKPLKFIGLSQNIGHTKAIILPSRHSVR